MKLVELFDKPYPLQWDESDPRDVTAYFYTGSDNRVIVNFIHLAHEVVEINFMMELKDPNTGYISRTFDATGTGDAPRIFATVVGAIHDYVSDREPDYIWFSAKENEISRIRLYDAMIKRAMAKNAAYELLPSDRWRELPDQVEDLVRSHSSGFRGWLFRDRRLTK
jgi:hypothetical protein